MPNMHNIICPNCHTLFGKEQDGVLFKKYKDMYLEIEGRVAGPCRKCGAQVVWPSESSVIVIERRG